MLISIKFNGNYIFLCLFMFVCLLLSTSTKKNRKTRYRFITTPNPNTRKICLKVDQTWKGYNSLYDILYYGKFKKVNYFIFF